MPRLTLPTFTPHPGQRAILSQRKSRMVACMGRRWGKTSVLTEVLVNYPGGALGGVDGKGRKGLPTAWYAPNDSYFQKVYQGIAQAYAPVIKRAVTAPRPYIEFKNGGSIDFWTLENPMKCGRGNFYARVIIDEASHARHLQDAWEQTIEYTLADLNGDAWFISTPQGLNYFHELWQKGNPDNPQRDPAWASFTAPSMDNPHLPPGWMDEKRATSPALVFAQEVLAQFVTFGAGLVKPEMLIDAPCPAHLPVVIGVDLAISEKTGADFTAIVSMCRCPDSGRVYIKEAERFQSTFSEVLARIKAAAARQRPRLIAIEQTQYQAAVVQELTRTTTLPVRGVRPDRDKVTRFAPLLTRFEQLQVRLDPAGCPAWLREELLGFPVGKHDDGVDALSYAWGALDQGSHGYASAGSRTF